ncbi:MAG: hypothetical protein JRN20_12370 [Nitrososphaerota archaeon]|nr:hypothetical protein [Nitrososphaerota archaeon]
MSFSTSSGRSFGGKSSQRKGRKRKQEFRERKVAQRKDQKKRQEFHKHKLKFTEEQHLDFEQLKSRVIVALDKLGHQVFSVELGGYTFHNWMTSFNLLLDDFEEKAGPKNLPKVYFDARGILTEDLVKPADTADLDWEIQNLETEIESVTSHMSEYMQEDSGNRENRLKISSTAERLRTEEVELKKKIAQAVDDLNKAKKKRSVFRKLLSNSKNSSIDSAKNTIEILQSRIVEIEKNLHELQSISQLYAKDFNNELNVLVEKLRNFQQSEAEFIAKKDKISQLPERRIEATAALSQIISLLKLGELTMEEKTAELE